MYRGNGQMDSPVIDEDEMLKHAIYQQLFLGDNQIMGKNPQNIMYIEGVDELKEDFYQDLKSHLCQLKTNNLSQFLHYFARKFNTHLNSVRGRIEENLSNMDNLKDQEIVIIYMVLTKVLETLREKAYRLVGEHLIKQKFRSKTNKYFTKVIAEKVQRLAALNDEDISLLYNLSFIEMLAEKYQNNSLKKLTQNLILTRLDRIIEKITA